MQQLLSGNRLIELAKEGAFQMKFYEFGEENRVTIMLIPGTKCHWKNNFDQVIPLLQSEYHVICVSYDGFDETENTIYPDTITETEKIEAYVKEKFRGKLDVVYGCSLGGSFVGLLIARHNIHIAHGILGSSDLDQSSAFAAKLNQKLTNPIVYKYPHRGYMSSWMEKLMIRFMGERYTNAALKMMGIGGEDMSFVSKESCFNQDYYDVVTPIPDHISVRGTKVHIFYALKMGKKYEKRYLQHFDNPDIRRHDLEHEELLMCYPKKWVDEIKCCLRQTVSAE